MTSPSQGESRQKERSIWKIWKSEVWLTVQKYQDTLEYLDIFHEIPADRRHNGTTNHFGLLKHLTKVKYLSASAEVLIGG
jgi:hypothetical protein